MGESIVIASGKGGVGKTSVTAGLGSALAALGKSVVCVDGDIGLRNLDLALGLHERSVFDYGDVLTERVPLDDALIEHEDIPGLFLLAAPSKMSGSQINASRFLRMVEALRQQVDFVLVDAPAGLDTGFTLAAEACRSALVVTTPDQLAIRDAVRCAERLSAHNSVRLVVNRLLPRLIRMRHAINIDDVMDTTGLPLLGLVPEDEMVIAAQNHNTPVLLLSHNGASLAYLNMAERLCGRERALPRRLRQWRVDS